MFHFILEVIEILGVFLRQPSEMGHTQIPRQACLCQYRNTYIINMLGVSIFAPFRACQRCHRHD